MVALPENSGGQVIVPKINVPVGHWKDGLCDCFTYGPFHNHCCISCFCPLSKSRRSNRCCKSWNCRLTFNELQLQQDTSLVVWSSMCGPSPVQFPSLPEPSRSLSPWRLPTLVSPCCCLSFAFHTTFPIKKAIRSNHLLPSLCWWSFEAVCTMVIWESWFWFSGIWEPTFAASMLSQKWISAILAARICCVPCSAVTVQWLSSCATQPITIRIMQLAVPTLECLLTCHRLFDAAEKRVIRNCAI